MPKRHSPDWPSWLRAMMPGEARRSGAGVYDRSSQVAVDLGVGLGHVEQAKHLLALEPGHLKGALDEVPVVILADAGQGGLAGLGHARDHLHGPGFVGRQRERAADGDDGIQHRSPRCSIGRPCRWSRRTPRDAARRPAAADEPGAVGLVRDCRAGQVRGREHVEHPGRLLAGRAGTAAAEDGPVLGQDLGRHEQVAERRDGPGRRPAAP